MAGKLNLGSFFQTNTVQFGIGYSVFIGCRMVRDIAVARILGPEVFGIWVGLAIYRQYSAYSDFGFTNGLGRVLPKALHEGKEKEGRVVMGLAWVTAMGGTLFFALAITAFFFLSNQATSNVMLWGIVVITCLMFIEKHYMYSQVTFRSAGRVGESGTWMGLLGFLELVFGLWFTILFGLYGLYGSLILSSLITIGSMYFRQPLRCLFQFDRKLWKPLAVAAFVMMGFGLTAIALHNVDRVAILYYEGTGQDLGQYHIASTLSLVASYIPTILLTVLAPNIYRFGGQSHAELKKYMLLPTAMMATFGVVVVSFGWLIFPPLIHGLLPQYHSTPSLMGALLLAELFFAVSMVSDNIMVALDRGFRGLAVRSGNVVIGFGLSVWALGKGFGLMGVAWAMCFSQAIGMVSIGILSALGTKVPIGRYFLVGTLPLFYGGAVQVGLYSLFGSNSADLYSTILEGVICLGALFPLVIVPLGYLGRGPLSNPIASQFLYWREEK